MHSIYHGCEHISFLPLATYYLQFLFIFLSFFILPHRSYFLHLLVLILTKCVYQNSCHSTWATNSLSLCSFSSSSSFSCPINFRKKNNLFWAKSKYTLECSYDFTLKVWIGNATSIYWHTFVIHIIFSGMCVRVRVFAFVQFQQSQSYRQIHLIVLFVLYIHQYSNE